MDKKQTIAFWILTSIAIFSATIIFYGFYVGSRIFIDNPHRYSQVDYIDRQISQMTMKDQISALFILHPAGSDKAKTNEFIEKYKPSGLIFMNDNISDSGAHFADMAKSINYSMDFPLLLAVDEEGGLVKRFNEDTFGSAYDSKESKPEAIAEAFSQRTNLLSEMGLNLNFGIVADMTDDDSSFIYPRSFGANSADVALKINSAVTSTNPKTLSTIKHFPGHGETIFDSHSVVPTSNIDYESWLATTARPFKAGIDAGADFVMFGHLIFSNIDDRPASLSKKWHEILQNELNFNGINITDDMRMLSDSNDPNYHNPISNAIDALKAGNDMLLYVLGPDQTIGDVTLDAIIDHLVRAVETKKVKYSQIHSSLRKVLTVRYGLRLVNI